MQWIITPYCKRKGSGQVFNSTSLGTIEQSLCDVGGAVGNRVRSVSHLTFSARLGYGGVVTA